MRGLNNKTEIFNLQDLAPSLKNWSLGKATFLKNIKQRKCRRPAKKALNALIAKRGDAVHQANTSSNPSCTPHLVKRDELEKAIRFLKGLVEATDKVKMVK